MTSRKSNCLHRNMTVAFSMIMASNTLFGTVVNAQDSRQPSATTTRNETEVVALTTNSPSSDDPEFENYINVARLRLALHNGDAAQLAEVAVDFIVAQRALGRAHNSISADKIFDAAMELASQNGDSQTLERLKEIAVLRANPALIAKGKLSATSRSVSTADWFAEVNSYESFGIYSQVHDWLTRATAIGEPELIESSKKLVAQATALSAAQQSDLTKKIEDVANAVPETQTPESIALSKLVGASRGSDDDRIRATWARLSAEEKQRVIAAGLEAARMQPGRSPANQSAAADGGWTLMLYLAADSNLERAIMKNLEEAIHIGSQPGVNVIVLADRHPNDDDDLDESDLPDRYTSRDIANIEDWSGAQIFYVAKDELTLLKDLGEDANTGDQETLEQFLQLAVSRYPAARYGLIVSGHGLAWENICPDDTPSYDDLSMNELRDAIQQGIGQPLEFLGFDACLMANFEVLQTLATTARVIVASEESSPGDGWNYVSLLRTLSKNPNISGLDLGIAIGEAFEDYVVKDTAFLEDYTLSVIDMQKFSMVERSLDYLAKLIGSEMVRDVDSTWQRIGHAAANSTDYGRYEQSDPPEPLIDLVGFTTGLAESYDRSPIQTAVQRLNSAIKEAVVFEQHGKKRAGTNGISIFLPHRRSDRLESLLEAYSELPLAEENAWFALVERAVTLANIVRPGEMFFQLIAQEDEGEYILTTQLVDADNFEEAELVLVQDFGKTSVVMGRADLEPYFMEPLVTDENDQLQVTYDGNWFTLLSGEDSILCPSAYNAGTTDDEYQLIAANFQLARAGRDKWVDVVILFQYDPEYDYAEYLGATISKNGEQNVVRIAAGDQLRPLLEVVDNETGESDFRPNPRAAIRIADPADLIVGLEPIPAGRFSIGFVGFDLNGNIDAQMFEIPE
jgi:hypothetical protein